jgi:hypothetical protein
MWKINLKRPQLLEHQWSWADWEESAIRSQNKRIIYNVHKFFKDIFEQPEHFSNINVHVK